MNLHEYFYYISFISILNVKKAGSERNYDLSIVTSGLETVSPCSAGLVFFVDVNNGANDDFEVVLTPDECCVNNGQDIDCDVVYLDGEDYKTVTKGNTCRLRLISPLIDPYERNGYCVAFLDSQPTSKRTKTMRDTIKIPFDTRIKSNEIFIEEQPLRPCDNYDQDPLNDCKPVDCDTYYNGQKPHFDGKIKRCVKSPSCVDNNHPEEPKLIYDPDINKCVEHTSIANNDIDLINREINGKLRQPKDIIIIRRIKAPNIHHSSNLSINSNNKDNDSVDNTSQITLIDNVTDFNTNYLINMMRTYASSNKISLMILGIVILIQCALLCLMFYFYVKTCKCQKKQVISRFFNYRQDASVTTPLIGTSNIDTDTTDYQYTSESSNIDKKIKCYKACQKERDVKMSMSDDILSKCLNRRDWIHKPIKSEVIMENSSTITDEIVMKVNAEHSKGALYKAGSRPKYKNESTKKSVSKISFEDEVNDRKVFENNTKSKNDTKKRKKHSKYISEEYSISEYSEDLNCSSEKEIKSFSYNNIELPKSNYQATPKTTHVGYVKPITSKDGSVSIVAEKEAQVYFSNDSLDDYISERGAILLDDDNFLSKYSYSTESKNTPITDGTSNASRNNIVHNVLSLFRRKSKKGPASDPGEKKSSVDLKLIHMSKVSLYSSSNNDSAAMKNFKIKESRSSM